MYFKPFVLLFSILLIVSNTEANPCEISSYKTNPKIQDAIHLAKKHHHGIFRKFDGLPYFSHPNRVANTVKKYTKDQDLIIAAYLHDLLEDTYVTKRQIKKRFGKKVAKLVVELSSYKSKIKKMGSKAEYLAWKMQNMSPEALLIKLADRLDNVSDFELADIDFINNYRDETNYILSKTLRREDLSEVHIKLITEIYKAMKAGEALFRKSLI